MIILGMCGYIFLSTSLRCFTLSKLRRIQVETQTGQKVKYLQSNNGNEYNSEEFHRFNTEEKITRHFTTVYIPQQNAVFERFNKTVLEKVQINRIRFTKKPKPSTPQFIW